MPDKKYSTKCSNDIIKIIVYMVFMTTLFLFYCNNKNDEIENSIDYYHLYNNEVMPSTKNGKKKNVSIVKYTFIFVITCRLRILILCRTQLMIRFSSNRI